jgi:hypothetical protein
MSAISGIVGASAAESAANTQADATTTAARESAAIQREMFNKGVELTAPWREAGANALVDLVSKVKAGPGEYTSSPGYQFRLNEGLNAITNAASAKGNVLSPATTKALTRYAEDYATGDYQNFLANYYSSLTPWQSLAGVGQTTASQNAVNATSTGANLGNTALTSGMAAGNAQAGGVINQANALTGALNSGVNNYLLWKYLNKGATAAGTAGLGGGGEMLTMNALGDLVATDNILSAAYMI